VGQQLLTIYDYMLMSYNKWVQYSGPGYFAHFSPPSGLVLILVYINKSVYKWFSHHNENATNYKLKYKLEKTHRQG
jgi:hypothetical protein